ncbi:MAG: DsbA family protein [Geminicoccaceae bacterium]|nr:DsbA family protein [Geminicoccaceae bacterium]MDW8369618.1 DsbA family protein [Geminicoccaceae bacterium]
MRIDRRGCLAVGLGLVASVVASAEAATVAERALGDPAAKVTMVEWFSMTCPHCAAFHLKTLPELKQRYIDTGKLRLVVRDFPTDGVALKAHVLAHCAGPERYFQFVDAFLASQERWAGARDPIGGLKQIAKLGGLSDQQIDACLADQAMENAVLQVRLDAQQKHDIRSTPSFLLNGKVHSGNRSPEEFAKLLDPLLR